MDNKVYIFAITDLHATNNFPYRKNVEGINDGIHDINKIFANIYTKVSSLYAIKNNKTILVIMGDVFHSYYFDPISVSNMLDNINIVSEWFNDIFIMVGNHDKLNDNENNLAIFRHIRKVKIINKDIHYPMYGVGITFIPFSTLDFRKQEDNMLDLIKKRPKMNKNVLFVHNDIKGAKFDNSVIAEDGFSMSKLSPAGKIGKHYDYVLGGHIHKRQLLKGKNYESKKTHLILGSPFQQSFSEAEQLNKGYCILDTFNSKIKFVNINSKYFFKVDISIGSVFEDIRNYFNDFDKDWKFLKNSIVRIKIKCQKDNVDKLIRTKNKIKIFLKKYKVENIIFSIETIKTKNRIINLDKISDNKSRILKYNKVFMPKKKHNKRLNKTMMEVYKYEEKK